MFCAPSRLKSRLNGLSATWYFESKANGSQAASGKLMALVLGLNAYHGDASACLVRDGELVAAAEEERFRRIKHWAGFPSEAIRYCLREARLQLKDVDHVAVNQDNRAHLLRKVGYVLTHLPTVELIRERLRMRRERESVSEL